MDERIEKQLNQLSLEENLPTSEMALRLLRRALRDKRPKNTYDREAVRAHAASFSEEDAALAESDPLHRAAQLDAEDTAA